MKLFQSFLVLLLLAAQAAGASAREREFRVRVLSKYHFKTVEVRGAGLMALGPDQAIPLDASEGQKVSLAAHENQVELGGRVFARIRLRSSAGPLEISGGGLQRRFSGSLFVEARRGELAFVEQVSLEAYVREVLAAELPEDFSAEAQKAQAVLIRSFALSHRGRHAEEGYDFCDLTHCQVYGGLGPASALREEAVRATRGLILSYQGRPIEGLFHSTCGGHTSANQRVFGGKPLPYLQGVSDGDYCAVSPHYRWSARLPLREISAILAEDPRWTGSIPLRGLALGEREPQGRVFNLSLEGPRRASIETMDFLSELGRKIGWNQLKSNWFELSVKDGIAEFEGRGLGHGVGMCQWGARGMAERGKRFDEILRHYFPGTKLSHLH
ncbi:MAG: SpoIID/LytB domain-containing protein [bacterium]